MEDVIRSCAVAVASCEDAVDLTPTLVGAVVVAVVVVALVVVLGVRGR